MPLRSETQYMIINSAAEVVGLAGTSLPASLNMVGRYGVEPTTEEANVLMRAAEDYSRAVRAMTQGWVARVVSPATDEPNRRKEDIDA